MTKVIVLSALFVALCIWGIAGIVANVRRRHKWERDREFGG